MLISFEGVDCSGKELQSKLLEEKLTKEGKKVARLSLPFYDSPTGKIIGRPFLGKDNNSYFEEGASHVDPYVASLFYVADRKYNLDRILSALKDNDVLILDRYVFSNMAHQGCKMEERERVEFFDFITKLEFEMLHFPKPDKVFFLDLPIDFVNALKKKRQEREDDNEKDNAYLQRSRETYLQLVEKYNLNLVKCVNNGILRTPEDIAEEIYRKIYE